MMSLCRLCSMVNYCFNLLHKTTVISIILTMSFHYLHDLYNVVSLSPSFLQRRFHPVHSLAMAISLKQLATSEVQPV